MHHKAIGWLSGLALIALHGTQPTQAASAFTEVPAGFPGLSISSAAWGDYDNDGDLDLLLAGRNSANAPLTELYRKDPDGFHPAGAGLLAVWGAAVAWGDYDNDGDLDLLIAGYLPTEYKGVSKVYRNDAGAFVDLGAPLAGIYDGTAAWGDADDDGDLDLFLLGHNRDHNDAAAKVYYNDGGTFSRTATLLEGLLETSESAWGDYDNDGDPDLVVTGYHIDSGQSLSKIYRNDSGTFVDIEAGLPGISAGSASWADDDQDGDLDLLLVGWSGSENIARIYRNNGGTFQASSPDLTTSRGFQSADWGDYDNDGDLDVVLTGSYESTTRIYRDGGASFTEIDAGLADVSLGDAAWGDYDNDGDLDLLVTGNGASGPSLTKLYKNNTSAKNTPPAAPAGLHATIAGRRAELGWNAASDAQTPAASLTYNVRVGRASGSFDVLSPMSDPGTGRRRQPAYGNAQLSRSTVVQELEPGTYFWSVQSIDSAFAGSGFAQEGSFEIAPFEEMPASLTGVARGAAAWGDYDSDGDLDLVMTGAAASGRISDLWYNTDGVGGFTQAFGSLPALEDSSAAWGDYDGDGDLDLALIGMGDAGRISRIYRNSTNTFTDLGANLPGLSKGAIAWGDFDADGDLDLLLTGELATQQPASFLYRNVKGVFQDAGMALTPIERGAVVWGDFDNDADLDLAISGWTGSNVSVTEIYENELGVLTKMSAPVGQAARALAWGDSDADGKLDLLASSLADAQSLEIYHNAGGGGFSPTGIRFPSSALGAADWGDYDNDGDLDLVLADGAGKRPAAVFRNENGSFTDIGGAFPGLDARAAAWGDADGDGDLDLLLAGAEAAGASTRVYRNDGARPNARPVPPAQLQASFDGEFINFSWIRGHDAETPALGLSYNLRVGTEPGQADGVASMSDLETGLRRLPSFGNAGKSTHLRLRLPPANTYYWSVQAIDAGKAASPFASEHSFAPVFEDIQAGLYEETSSRAAWVDYDGDGDLDPFTAGLDHNYYVATKLYRNEGAGRFIDPHISLPPRHDKGAMAWTDYDGDGDADLLLTDDGCVDCSPWTRIYRNNGFGVFTDIEAPLSDEYGFFYSTAAFGDYDQDGDVDLLAAAAFQPKLKLFRNDHGSFVASGILLPDLQISSLAWVDVDGDGDLDFSVTGGGFTKIYQNEQGQGFTEMMNTGLPPGLSDSSMAWGDFENDGDLDLLLIGAFGGVNVFKNNGVGQFMDVQPLPGTSWSDPTGTWGDYDQDGDLDVLVSGSTYVVDHSITIVKLFRNDGEAGFVDQGGPQSWLGTVDAAWGDEDQDGDLDWLLTGVNAPRSRIYRNRTLASNTPPSAPTGLLAEVLGENVTLSWAPSSDTQTAAPGLSYNLRIGTSPGASNVQSPLSMQDGRRIVPSLLGNVQNGTTALLRLPPENYFWSVQAIDSSFAGSGFSAEGTFSVLAGGATVTPTATPLVSPTPTSTYIPTPTAPPLILLSSQSPRVGNMLSFLILAVAALLMLRRPSKPGVDLGLDPGGGGFSDH